MNLDISSIAEENHRYAIHLATFQNIISYKNSSYDIKKRGISLFQGNFSISPAFKQYRLYPPATQKGMGSNFYY